MSVVLRCMWPYGTPSRAEGIERADRIVTGSTNWAGLAACHELPKRPKVSLSVEIGLCIPRELHMPERWETSYRMRYAQLAESMGLLTRHRTWGVYEAIDLRDPFRVMQYAYAMGQTLGSRGTYDLEIVDDATIDTSIFTDVETRIAMGAPTNDTHLDLLIRSVMRAFVDGFMSGPPTTRQRLPVWVNTLGCDVSGTIQTRSLAGLDPIVTGIKHETFGTPNRASRYGEGWEKIRAHLEMLHNAACSGYSIDFECDAQPNDSQRERARYYTACSVIYRALSRLYLDIDVYWNADRYVGTGLSVDPGDLNRAERNLSHEVTGSTLDIEPDNVATITGPFGLRRVFMDTDGELSVSDKASAASLV